MKVAVIGAAGGIGQALSLLLKIQLPAGSDLMLYDTSSSTPGVAKDLSHISTDVKIEGFCGEDPSPALKGADIVLISAGIGRKPGMLRRDLFNINAGIIRDLTEKIAVNCPKACVAIITNPLNSTVPIAAAVLKKAGVYDPRKLFGVTTLDVIRGETFIAEAKGISTKGVRLNIIGGHSGVTILPLLSQVEGLSFTDDEVINLTKHIQNAGTEVIEAKAGDGSATLSMSDAAARFGLALVDALNGKEDIVQCAYVDGGSELCQFFAQQVRLGKNGIEAIIDYGELSDYEEAALEGMLDTLKDDIKIGNDFIS